MPTTDLRCLISQDWDKVKEEIIKHDCASTDVNNAASEWLFVLQRMIPKNASRHREHVRLVAVGESSSVFLPVGSIEPCPYLLSLRCELLKFENIKSKIVYIIL
jgi:hypothetical protein